MYAHTHSLLLFFSSSCLKNRVFVCTVYRYTIRIHIQIYEAVVEIQQKLFQVRERERSIAVAMTRKLVIVASKRSAIQRFSHDNNTTNNNNGNTFIIIFIVILNHTRVKSKFENILFKGFYTKLRGKSELSWWFFLSVLCKFYLKKRKTICW